MQAVPLDGGIWEIGYHIGAKYTKHGYATEAVSAFLPVIMERIGVTKMAGICLADNIASQKVMEKCGFILIITKASKKRSAAIGMKDSF